MAVNGYLSVWKPSGPTSFDVVRRIRRASRTKRVGHGGTLDPAAEGILPILLGHGTRMSEELEACAKAYRARILLGTRTDTLDLQGVVLEERDPSGATQEEVLTILPDFTGVIRQVPPMYSALKRQGQRLYDLARQGIEVDRAAREVTVYSIELVDWAPPHLTLDVVCGRGTYIRSLAADLGDRLGCGAVLEHLVRKRVGPFREEEAVGLETAEAAFEAGEGERLVTPLVALFPGWPALRLRPTTLRQVTFGAPLSPEASEWTTTPGSPEPPFTPMPPSGRAVALGPEGGLVALLNEETTGRWHPRKVLITDVASGA